MFRFFLQILPKLHFITPFGKSITVVQLAKRLPSRHETRGRGFEPVMMDYIFSGKYPGA